MTEWVQVRLATERYAIDVADALEVGLRGEVTRVPGAPPAVLGVHNLRGQVLPVVDLSSALSVPPDGTETGPYFVVIEAGGDRAALAVDEILAVGALDGSVEAVETGSIRGRVVADGGLYGVLDVERLLAAVRGVPA